MIFVGIKDEKFNIEVNCDDQAMWNWLKDNLEQKSVEFSKKYTDGIFSDVSEYLRNKTADLIKAQKLEETQEIVKKVLADLAMFLEEQYHHKGGIIIA